MGDNDRKPMLPLWLLVLTMFGIYTFPKASGPESPPAKAAQGENKTPGTDASGVESAVGSEGRQRLADLLTNYSQVGPNPNKSIKEVFNGDATTSLRDCRCLIAAVPHPSRSTSGYLFDEYVTAIQRGVESQGYVLDRYSIPWSQAIAKTESAAGKAEPEKGALPERKQPGLILFRGPAQDDSAPPVLIVFLIPETATSGVDKQAFAEALDWARALDADNDNTIAPCEFSILGPTFSGSQSSLETTLVEWRTLQCEAERTYHFDIVAGAALAIKKSQLEGAVNRKPSHKMTITFQATCHTNAAVEQVVLRFLDRSRNQPVAMLVEAGTGFGLNVVDKNHGTARGRNGVGKTHTKDATAPNTGEANGRVIYYRFPLNVSRLRDSYAEKGDGNDSVKLPIRATERLEIGSKGQDNLPDVIAPRRPEITTPLDELVLNEILMDIARREIRLVGITATDALDVVFLAQRVRQFVPDARIFTTQNTLVFTHPKTIADLRGMIVGSTYPLLAQNQAWSFPYGADGTRSFFTSDDAEGVYNATVAHLHRRNIGNLPPRFLEYGRPYDDPRSSKREGESVVASHRSPPIWVGVVGNHGIYPLRAQWEAPPEPKEDEAGPGVWKEDKKYVFSYDQTASDLRSLGVEDSTPPILKQFRPSFPCFWAFVYVSLSLFGLGQAVVALWHLWLALGPRLPDGSCDRTRGWGSLTWLATRLNFQKAPGASANGYYFGPGFYLGLKLLLTLIIYSMVSAPLTDALQGRWFPAELSSAEFGLIGLTCFVWTALVVGLIATVIAACVDWLAIRSLRRAKEGAPKHRKGKTRVERESPAWNLPRSVRAILLAAACVAVGGSSATLLLRDSDPRADRERSPQSQIEYLLLLERSMALPSGVSPVLPLLFLGTAGSSWVIVQLRRRYLLEQVTTAGSTVHATSPVPSREDFVAKIWRDVLSCHADFQNGLHSPRDVLRQLNPATTAFALVTTFYFLSPLLTMRGSRRSLETVVDVIFCVYFAAMVFHWLQLLLLWRQMRKLLRLVARLPLLQAMDRMPPRVARWFFETPSPGGGRFEMVQRQAQALANVFGEGAPPAQRHGHGAAPAAKAANNPLLRELDEVFEESGDKSAWTDLKGKWTAIKQELQTADQRTLSTSLVKIRPILLAYWQSEPVTLAFAETPEPSTGKTGSNGETGGLRAIAMALVEKKVPAEEPARFLPGWVREAEDLFALATVRWLAASLAQLWGMIGFLVLGSLALLLAVSSYPFPLQSHMFAIMGTLIVLIVAAVAWVILGLNTDELLSRIANTTPNKLKIDGQLVSSLMTYIVPLVGVLAALSFDTSDTVHAILDPILRHLH